MDTWDGMGWMGWDWGRYIGGDDWDWMRWMGWLEWMG